MLVRNRTGVVQVLSGAGIALPPDKWMDIPYDHAVRLFRQRTVDLELPEDTSDFLWKNAEGTHLYWMSPFSMGDGYATAAENMIHALVGQGMNVHIAACWFVSKYGLRVDTIKMLDKPLPGMMKVGLCMATPGEFKKLPTPYKIGLTMYEADDPLHNMPEWRHDCDAVDMLIVPSEYCKEIFSSFVKVPIKVAPLAVNSRYYTGPTHRRVARDRPFTFVTHGTLTGRKAPLELIDCFLKAFPRREYPDVRLQLKTRMGMCGWAQDQLPTLTDPRIQIYNKGWLPQKLAQWLLQADAYVYPSKGEGFGLPPREAMATGLPTIFANHTGMTSFANEEYNWPIPVGKTEESPLGGVWRLCDWDYLIDVMRWVYHNREEAWEKAWRGSQWFIDNHGADAAARDLIQILESVDPDCRREIYYDPPESAEAHREFYNRLQTSLTPPAAISVPGQDSFTLCSELARLGYYLRFGQKPGDLCISQGTLQELGDHEIARAVMAMLELAPHVRISVPSVYYPEPFSARSRLMRMSQWEDILVNFEISCHYYGEGQRYLDIEVTGMDLGRHVTVAKKGRVLDHTWRPPRDRTGGKPTG